MTSRSSGPEPSNTAAQVARRVMGLLDLTSLGDGDDAETVRRLCHAATNTHGSVPAVCVWPQFVGVARDELAGGSVKIAAVSNFPSGAGDVDAVVAESAQIVADGADEVDVVFPWRDHLASEPALGRELVRAVREAVGPEVVLKVILETGELDDVDLIVSAAHAAVDGGADFLKTSTGKTPTGATPAAVGALLRVIGECRDRGSSVGLKVSGGVRDLDTAADYLDLVDAAMGASWATAATMRFGASSLLDDVLLVLDDPSAR